MLVTFIGCPSSGKTTTAAMLFAYLKETGIPTEFLLEEARMYITRMRWESQLKPHEGLTLENDDQFEIMEGQWTSEDILTQVCGPSVVVISDGNALNSLLYMTPEYRKSSSVQEIVDNAIENYDLVFYLPPLKQPNIFDPNRIHDYESSIKIDSLIPEMLKQFAPRLTVIRLEGEPKERLEKATSCIRNKYSSYLSSK